MQDPSKSNAKSMSQDGSKSTTPNRGSHQHHRRAHSETNFRLSNDLDPLDAPTRSIEEIASEDDLFTTYLDVDKLGSRIDDDCSAYNAGGENMSATQSRIRHRHSNSVDGSLNSSGDNLLGDVMEPKKAMPPDKLAELWTLDPKRVKRILANRQSAARSKEQKARYILELERKVQTLQTEAITLSVQLTLFQRDTMGLTTENTELKLRLQAMEQQAQLRDALNEALKQEVERLKIATGESVNSGNSLHLGMHYMPYNSSPVSSLPQPGPGGDHLNIQSQLHSSRTNLTNHNMLAAHSSSLSELQQDPLGLLEGLAISNRARQHLVKSEGPLISASESSNTL